MTPSPTDLERLLETGFGATGQSLSEKLLSVESRLPAPLVTQLRAVFATARQLETGGTVDVSSYRRMLESSAEQLELLAIPKPKLETHQAVTPTPAPATPVRRLGSTPRAPAPSRLRVWLYNTRQGIPKRAYSSSRTWRVPGSVLGLLLGTGAGWLLAGVGGAVAGAVGLGIISFFGLSESALARGMWAQTNAVEGLFALLRLLGRAALAVLVIVAVGLVVFFVTRFWNVR